MKIVYINQYNISDSVAQRIQEIDSSYDHESMKQAMHATLRQGFYCRKGHNSLPFVYNKQFFRTGMPDIDCNYNKSFGEITRIVHGW